MNIPSDRPVISRAEWRWVGFASALLLAATVAPIVLVALRTPSSVEFTGLIYSWDDSTSYLATMREGMRGQWLYTLPYTAENSGAFFLFLHYIFLGHVAGWLHLDPVVVYHLARLLGGALVLPCLYVLCARLFSVVPVRRFAFLLACIGSGLGWATLFAHPTPDLWQPEAFPFLSILANPHFTWGLLCFLSLVDLLTRAVPLNRWQWLWLVVSALILALIQPYGLLTVCAVVGVWLMLRIALTHEWPRALILRLVVVGVIAALFAGYYRWAQANIPAFAGWEKQDITLSPGPVDYLIAGGLPLLLTLAGAALALRRIEEAVRRRDFASVRLDVLLLLWLCISAALMYEPFTHHQRRFAFALFVPVALLGAQGFEAIVHAGKSRARIIFLAVSSLSNVTLLLIAFIAASQYPDNLFFSRSEWNALLFLRAQPPDQVVLTSPVMGMLLPAWTDDRVVYGHPHETLEAASHRKEVEQFFSNTLADPSSFLSQVSFIFVGPRERALGSPAIPSNFVPVFTDGNVAIYARQR